MESELLEQVPREQYQLMCAFVEAYLNDQTDEERMAIVKQLTPESISLLYQVLRSSMERKGNQQMEATA